MMAVQACVLHGIQDLRLEDRELEPPADDELQIRIASTGLCGSDIHYYRHFRNGDILVREPLALGHESSGIVESIGANVSGFQVGDKVALEVGVPCDRCPRCVEGRYNICKDLRFRSSGKSFPHFQGTLQEKISHPAKWCHRLPDEMSLELGALIEPLSVAVHAFRRSLMPKGANIIIFGAGAIGLLCAAVAVTEGARRVIITDVDQGRLDFAVEKGFAHVSHLSPMRRGENVEGELALAKDNATAITSRAEFEGADVVFECTGVPSCVQSGIYALRPGGRLVLVGMGHPIQTLPLAAAALREVDIVGVFRYANTYPDAIALIRRMTATDGPDLASLITHRYQGLSQAKSAFDMAGKTKDDKGALVLKVMINA